jgi:hypothetical protein
MTRLRFPITVVIVVVLFVWVDARAQGQGCNNPYPSTSYCPLGHCPVVATVFTNGSCNGCYKNQGDTIDCPSPCDGEYVYTATSAGTCEVDSPDHCVCDWDIRYIPLLRPMAGRPLIAKAYVPDCKGDLQLLLSDLRTAAVGGLARKPDTARGSRKQKDSVSSAQRERPGK